MEPDTIQVEIEETTLTVEDGFAFQQNAFREFRNLFSLAKEKHHWYFASALAPDSRKTKDPDWDVSIGIAEAFNDYDQWIRMNVLYPNPFRSINIRIALGFYCHLAEASSFYVVPKNMMRIIEGEAAMINPFFHLYRKRKNGENIPPNANAVIIDLHAHAKRLKLDNLADVFAGAFNPDMRNGFAHGDYLIRHDGIHFPNQLKRPVRISPNQFYLWLNRAVNFFQCIRSVIIENSQAYVTPQTFVQEFEGVPWECTVFIDEARDVMSLNAVKSVQQL
jgi:hypothetical protein